MPIETTRPGNIGWWLKRLIDRLHDRRDDYQVLDDYYTGQAAVPTLANKTVQNAYRRLMHFSRTNYAELVVEAVRERLSPVNFRTGAASDEQGDAEAWRIWQANQLDADSALIHRWSLTMRDAYVIVGPIEAEIGAPLITIEDPRYVIVEYDPARRRKARAALKMVRSEERGFDIAYLYILDGNDAWVLRAFRETRDGVELVDIEGLEWADQHRLPVPVVPVVGFHNRMSDRSWGEFEPHIALLDRINYGILNRLEIATLQAFKQRAWQSNQTHDENGQEIDYTDIFTADPGRIWHLPETGTMWESGQVDLGPLQGAIKDDVRDLAAVTRTPSHYLIQDSANQSAEGASLAREGLVYKVEDRQKQFGESWEQVMSLAFLFAGDAQRAARGDLETIWAPAERFSLAERYDAASKAKDVLPMRTIRTDVLQFSPQAADRMEGEDVVATLLAPEEPTVPALNA